MHHHKLIDIEERLESVQHELILSGVERLDRETIGRLSDIIEDIREIASEHEHESN